MHEVCVCVCVRVCACDVIRQIGYREVPSWRRQYVSLDICTQKTPSLCLEDRTVPQTAMNSDFEALVNKEVGNLPNGLLLLHGNRSGEHSQAAPHTHTHTTLHSHTHTHIHTHHTTLTHIRMHTSIHTCIY